MISLYELTDYNFMFIEFSCRISVIRVLVWVLSGNLSLMFLKHRN